MIVPEFLKVFGMNVFLSNECVGNKNKVISLPVLIRIELREELKDGSNGVSSIQAERPRSRWRSFIKSLSIIGASSSGNSGVFTCPLLLQ
jgi:hypothetical protein